MGDTFREIIQSILERPDVVIVGVNVAVDVHKLRKKFGMKIQRMRDVSCYYLHQNPNQSYSLENMMARY